MTLSRLGVFIVKSSTLQFVFVITTNANSKPQESLHVCTVLVLSLYVLAHTMQSLSNVLDMRPFQACLLRAEVVQADFLSSMLLLFLL
jgi:hypothetical protein